MPADQGLDGRTEHGGQGHHHEEPQPVPRADANANAKILVRGDAADRHRIRCWIPLGVVAKSAHLGKSPIDDNVLLSSYDYISILSANADI